MARYILIILFVLLNCIPPGVSGQWSQMNSFPGFRIQDLIHQNGDFYACTSSGVYKSTDDGISWSNISTGLTGDELITSEIFFDGPAIYVATVEGNFKTTNGGANWEAKSNGIQIGPAATKRYCFSFFKDGGTLFSGAFSGLYKSSDGGDSWTLSGIQGPHSFVEALYKYDEAIYAGRTSAVNATLYKSTNGGNSWTPVPFFGQFTPEVFAFHETPDGRLFIGTGHGVYFTTNNGANWTQRNNGLPSDPYNTSIVQRGNTMFTSTTFGANGVFRSSNEGLTWEDIGEGLPFISNINKLLIIADTLYLAGSDGIYKRPLSEILTNIIQTSSGVPENHSLSQNYPNPFNPETNIKFNIPSFVILSGAKNLVTLKVYNALGKEVAVLVNESLQPGSYSISFNASKLSSGIYFYTLSSSSFTQTKKMLLIK